MIAKTTTGKSFGPALEYGAGLKEGKENKPSQLLGASNLVARDPQGMAAEMIAVADSSRCQRPVWHTSLNWPKGETVEKQQLLRAASEYCRRMGADPTRHQVAIYQHHDRPHTHIHIYINRVPIDGGPALDTSHNYARNVKVCQAITEQLGTRKLPEQRQSLNDHNPHKQSTREYVQETIKTTLTNPQITTVEQLSEQLRLKGVESQFKHDSKGGLVGCSFRYEQTAVKGTEVGHKAKQIGQQLTLNQQEQNQSQSAWNALFAGYTAATEKDRWNELLTGYQQTKGEEMKQPKPQQEKRPEIEEKQQKTPKRGLGL
ncbi:relaxase/mobilization nuclease domain-containing protein [Spirosoma sp. 209]|uniref:relaxase/mobilization nuclease domain-containing protein n=1 Tax=Spirosoma sp. 209 TaxID=1955701 RepID=UPI00098D2578|nr:relaxase/mobilization nuclease domain-containing protein [Spirosoma sp. 209]